MKRKKVVKMHGIVGTGTTGAGGYDLSLAALLLPNGKAKGYVVLEGGVRGPVIQVVPPDRSKDHWCITVDRVDSLPGQNQHANVYIRDKGDGLTTFDSISFVTDIGADCKTYPDTLGVYLDLVEGDFVAV